MNLKDYLQQYGLSAAAYAARAGVPVSSVTRYLAGSRESVTPLTAAKMSAAAKGLVSVQEILFPHGMPKGARMTPRASRHSSHDAKHLMK